MVKLTGLRYGLHQDEQTGNPETRVVLEFSGGVKYRTGQLKNPLRMYIDFADTTLAMDQKEFPVNDKLVKTIRVGQFNRTTVRVVVELIREAPYQIFTLPAGKDNLPFRVVLDLSRAGETSPQPSLPQILKGKTIVLDPGHGGEDSGAVGPKGTREKDVVLDIALRTREFLAARGARVLLTRQDDTFVTLEDRANLANNNKAQVFVSIHNNSSPTQRPMGLETYYYPRSQAGRILAAKVQEALVAGLGWRNRGVKTAPFYVLRHTKMPACLAEVGFISNLQDEPMLADPANRQKAAEGIAGGVINYLSR